jgi:hypothetical protein
LERLEPLKSRMRTSSKILLVAIVVTALVPLWGYWYSIHHAYLNLRVDDYALKSPTQRYGDPHDVRLVLRDASNTQLAVAKSVEPLGYILAVHPDAAIGNCEQRKDDYPACYEQYSKWSSTWAAVGACQMTAVPVTVSRSNSEWPVWWVPLRHVGGLPREYFSFEVAVDSRACVAAGRESQPLR